MKFISAIVLMLSISSLANAAIPASASISNLRFEVLGGAAPSIDNDSIFTSSYASNNVLNDYHSSNQSIFDITSETKNDFGYAKASIKNGVFNALLFTEVSSNLGYAGSDTYETFIINYVANTTLNITADAFISGSSSSQDDYTTTFASVALRNQSLSYYKESTLQQYNVTNNNYSLGKVLSISFFSNENELLYFSAEVASTAYSATLTSPIPEPDTYILMSLGLLPLLIKRKRC